MRKRLVPSCMNCVYLLDCKLEGLGICELWEYNRISQEKMRRIYHTHNFVELCKKHPEIRAVKDLTKNDDIVTKYYIIKKKPPH